MKNNRQKPLFPILIALGLAVLTGAAILIISEIAKTPELPEKDAVLKAICEIMPQTRQKGMKEDRYNPEMPAYTYEGTDYAGILAVDSKSVTEPVLSLWNEKEAGVFPCRYSGNAYDGSLVIGGSTGNLRFVEEVDPGDKITFTDVKGNEFVYEVAVVNHSQDADEETLNSGESDLVIFTGFSNGSGYVIARCIMQ